MNSVVQKEDFWDTTVFMQIHIGSTKSTEFIFVGPRHIQDQMTDE